MKWIDPTGMDWYLNEQTGETYFNRDISDKTTTYKDQIYTRIGGNTMFGNQGEISERYYNAELSQVVANAFDYSINPTQQLVSENTTETSYDTGKHSTNIATGETTIINEKYGIFPKENDKQVNTKTETLYVKEYGEGTPLGKPMEVVKNMSGVKSTGYIKRNTYTYEKPTTGSKVGAVIGAIYNFLSITNGNHDYTNSTIYPNWNSYSRATGEKGKLLKYKQ